MPPCTIGAQHEDRGSAPNARAYGETRSRVTGAPRISDDVVVHPSDDFEIPRPKTRGDCLPGGVNEQRPCPWASCKWHAIHLRADLETATPDEVVDELEAMADTCILDVADRSDATLEDVAAVLGVTRERIRQIEGKAERKLRHPSRRNPLRVFRDGPEVNRNVRPEPNWDGASRAVRERATEILASLGDAWAARRASSPNPRSDSERRARERREMIGRRAARQALAAYPGDPVAEPFETRLERVEDIDRLGDNLPMPTNALPELI